MRLRIGLVVAFAAFIAACSDEGGTRRIMEPQIPDSLTAATPVRIVMDAGSEADTTIGVTVLDANRYAIPGAVVHFRVTSGGGSIRDTAVVTSVSGVALARGWKIGPGLGLNTVTANVGKLSIEFTALAVDPDAIPLSHYALAIVGGKLMPYASPWNDFDSIVLNEGSIDVFDGYFVRSWNYKALFGDRTSTEKVRGVATMSESRIELGTLNISLEVRGDSLYSKAEVLPDGYGTTLIYVRAAEGAPSVREAR